MFLVRLPFDCGSACRYRREIAVPAPLSSSGQTLCVLRREQTHAALESASSLTLNRRIPWVRRTHFLELPRVHALGAKSTDPKPVIKSDVYAVAKNG